MDNKFTEKDRVDISLERYESLKKKIRTLKNEKQELKDYIKKIEKMFYRIGIGERFLPYINSDTIKITEKPDHIHAITTIGIEFEVNKDLYRVSPYDYFKEAGLE